MDTDIEIEETPELTELEEAELALNEHTRDFIAEWEKPLTFKYDTRKVEIGMQWKELWGEFEPIYRIEPNPDSGQVASGILWIPPFVGGDEFYTKKKPKPVKCVCACCGSKHNKKGG